MHSNCSVHRLPPIDPACDPAYVDGPPPRPHPPSHAGEIALSWPIARLPIGWRYGVRLSLETLEDALEREARREERDQ